MADSYVRWPSIGQGVLAYANAAALPSGAADGTVAVTLDTDTLYVYDLGSLTWKAIGSPSAVLGLGTFDSGTPAATGAHIDSNLLVMQSASATLPGLMNTGTQTIAGAKTFSGAMVLGSTLNGNTITAGTGTLTLSTFTLTVTATASVGGTNTGDVTIGTASGLSLVGQALSLGLASAGVTGALSGTDWSTFNGKQAAGNYLTALTGDGAASGPGSATLTLATVNANVGSFGSSTSIPTFTVNAKGLITAASGSVVVAPAGTLSGATLAANVLASSLTSVGTIATGVWQGTAVGATYGGTGGTSAASTGVPKVTAGVWSYPAQVAVADGGTGLASGTSGGLLYFSGTGTVASSGAYTAGRVLTGNGAGNAPTSSTNFTYSSSILGLNVAGAVAPGTNGIVLTDTTASVGSIVTIGFVASGNTGTARIGSLVESGSSNAIVILTGGATPTEKVRVDGAGNLITSVGMQATQGYDTSTATSGTITCSANKPGLVINSAGGTTLTIKLPSSPIDGQQYFVASVGAFTTVTWQDSGAAANVVGGQAAIGGINRGQNFVYSLALTKWISIG